MRLAITTFGNQISPLFDTAQVIRLVDINGDRAVWRDRLEVNGHTPAHRVGILADHGVQLLVCGGINRQARATLEHLGITVHSWVSGEVEGVVRLLATRLGRDRAPGQDALVALTAAGRELDDELDPCFGRCRHLLLVRQDGSDLQVLPGPENGRRRRGSWTAVERLVAAEARALVTQRCGPNARGLLAAAGITVCEGAHGTVRQALDDFRHNKLIFNGFSREPRGSSMGLRFLGDNRGKRQHRGNGRGHHQGQRAGGAGRRGLGAGLWNTAVGLMENSRFWPAQDDAATATVNEPARAGACPVSSVAANAPVLAERYPIPQVDQEACTACGACVQVCGADAMTVDQFAVINEELCLSCEACVNECPEQAISMPDK